MEKPASLEPLADEILTELSKYPESAEIVLGGYFALQHYLSFRRSFDIDAWWRTLPSSTTEHVLQQAVQTVAARHGLELKERRRGDVLSLEFVRDGRKVFSFQIAPRSVELESPTASPWAPVLIETLRDNVGSKMNALVNRAAPRDFQDIEAIVRSGLADINECWRTWAQKNPGQSLSEAKQTVLLKLEAIEARRPLSSIEDPEERARIDALRLWYRSVFLGE